MFLPLWRDSFILFLATKKKLLLVWKCWKMYTRNTRIYKKINHLYLLFIYDNEMIIIRTIHVSKSKHHINALHIISTYLSYNLFSRQTEWMTWLLRIINWILSYYNYIMKTLNNFPCGRITDLFDGYCIHKFCVGNLNHLHSFILSLWVWDLERTYVVTFEDTQVQF